MERQIPLLGKVVIRGNIIVVTGLRIGGSNTGVKIGGIDHPVISDPFGRPFVPGSSLKGKMRALLEKKENVAFDSEGKHACRNAQDYQKCAICKIWGIISNISETTEEDSDKAIFKKSPTLTRLIVRDTYIDETSITEQMKRNLELQWTEVKMETAIDRITGKALDKSLRTVDRVPAGARFKELEIIFNCYEEEDKPLLVKVFEAMELVEHDYLGGMGSRGYGKVKFEKIVVYWNKKEDYESGNLNKTIVNNEFDTPELIVKNFEKILGNLK